MELRIPIYSGSKFNLDLKTEGNDLVITPKYTDGFKVDIKQPEVFDVERNEFLEIERVSIYPDTLEIPIVKDENWKIIFTKVPQEEATLFIKAFFRTEKDTSPTVFYLNKSSIWKLLKGVIPPKDAVRIPLDVYNEARIKTG